MADTDVVLTYPDFIDEWRAVSEREAFYREGICPHCEVDAPEVYYSDDSGVPGLP